MNTRSEIQQAYAELHEPEAHESLSSLDADEFYANLIGGVYGEITEHGDEFEIEISGRDSFSRNPILFRFPNPDHKD